MPPGRRGGGEADPGRVPGLWGRREPEGSGGEGCPEPAAASRPFLGEDAAGAAGVAVTTVACFIDDLETCQ